MHSHQKQVDHECRRNLVSQLKLKTLKARENNSERKLRNVGSKMLKLGELRFEVADEKEKEKNHE